MPTPPLRGAGLLLRICFFLCLSLRPRLASSEPDADKAALLAFLSGMGRGATARARINWPTTHLACYAVWCRTGGSSRRSTGSTSSFSVGTRWLLFTRSAWRIRIYLLASLINGFVGLCQS